MNKGRTKQLFSEKKHILRRPGSLVRVRVSLAGEISFQVEGLPISQDQLVPQSYLKKVIIFQEWLEIINYWSKVCELV